MFRSSTHLGSLRRLFLSLVAGWLTIMAVSSEAQTALNVTNFGARGDAVQFFANTTSNSVVVTTTTQIPSSAIGDAIEVFGVGVQTYGASSYGTNGYGNQDLVATITNVVNGTNIYISLPSPSHTLTNTFATYGHDNTVISTPVLPPLPEPIPSSTFPQVHIFFCLLRADQPTVLRRFGYNEGEFIL